VTFITSKTGEPSYTVIIRRAHDMMTNSFPFHETLAKLRQKIQPPHDDDVFIKTHLGRQEIENGNMLPQRLRMLLMLIDGKRSIGAFRETLTNFRGLDDAVFMLSKMGMIECLPNTFEI
jgi:hypothetical protein